MHTTATTRSARTSLTRCGAVLSLLIATGAGSVAFACTEPPTAFTPIMPDGLRASEAEMLRTHEQLHRFVDMLNEYIECTADEIVRIVEEQGAQADRAHVESLAAHRADAVSRRSRLLIAYEFQRHLFDSRDEHAGEFSARRDAERTVNEEMRELIEDLTTLPPELDLPIELELREPVEPVEPVPVE